MNECWNIPLNQYVGFSYPLSTCVMCHRQDDPQGCNWNPGNTEEIYLASITNKTHSCWVRCLIKDIIRLLLWQKPLYVHIDEVAENMAAPHFNRILMVGRYKTWRRRTPGRSRHAGLESQSRLQVFHVGSVSTAVRSRLETESTASSRWTEPSVHFLVVCSTQLLRNGQDLYLEWTAIQVSVRCVMLCDWVEGCTDVIIIEVYILNSTEPLAHRWWMDQPRRDVGIRYLHAMRVSGCFIL